MTFHDRTLSDYLEEILRDKIKVGENVKIEVEYAFLPDSLLTTNLWQF